LGFDETLTGKISIVVTELATNIVKHAVSGEIILIEGDQTLHILAIDRGPGMKNFENSLQDGTSTGGTAGNGLGAI
ncbi:anti-sigma regulatory factor, partial [Klebsiella pneumoniae]|nr:anti-sigma regulatory factor [Klebsiella pneumoniae]